MPPPFPVLSRFLLPVAALLPALAPASGAMANGSPAGIVLVISDGTSQELLTAARIYAKGVTGRLPMESFPQTAIVRTHSRSDVVTDSAAAATAMARGIKADNMLIGMANRASRTSPPSLLDLARQAGWSTGIVTDDSVTGATEGPFLVEQGSRTEEAAIAAKTLAALGPRADIVLGGGAQWFHDLSKTPGGGMTAARTDLAALSWPWHAAGTEAARGLVPGHLPGLKGLARKSSAVCAADLRQG